MHTHTSTNMYLTGSPYGNTCASAGGNHRGARGGQGVYIDTLCDHYAVDHGSSNLPCFKVSWYSPDGVIVIALLITQRLVASRLPWRSTYGISQPDRNLSSYHLSTVFVRVLSAPHWQRCPRTCGTYLSVLEYIAGPTNNQPSTSSQGQFNHRPTLRLYMRYTRLVVQPLVSIRACSSPESM